MAKPYSKERKMEILTYARDHGVNAACRHFGVMHATIRYWNKTLNIYSVKTAEYPAAMRRQVLEYATRHTLRDAAKHFGVSVAAIQSWNKQQKTYKPKQRKYSKENKLEVLYYAEDYGVTEAANKYDINPATIIEWNKEMHVYQTQKKYTEQDKQEILRFAQENGIIAASQEFGVARHTILAWNKIYNIYDPRHKQDYTAFSAQEKVKILNRAKKTYDALPVIDRSANQAFTTVAREYGATPNQLRKWNRILKIVPVQPHKKREITQTEINEAQSALIKSRGSVARASRMTGISEDTIKELKNSKKITFEKGKKRLNTNPAIGRNKARGIAEIIQMLMNSKSKQGKE